MKGYPELCRVCGVRLHDEPIGRPDRLCPMHLREAREAMGPVGCTAEDLGFDDRCPECGHEHQETVFCGVLTARLVCSYGKVVEDTGPFNCRCREPQVYA